MIQKVLFKFIPWRQFLPSTVIWRRGFRNRIFGQRSSLGYTIPTEWQTSTIPPSQPLVLVLGWLHASPRHLQKYLQLYHSLGYPTLYTTLPTPCTIFPQTMLLPTIQQLRHEIQHMRESLSDHSTSPRSLIIHTFSGNGGNTFALMHRIQPFENVLGCIYDSGPVLLTPEIYLKGILAALLPTLSHQPPSWLLQLAQGYFSTHTQLLNYLHESLHHLPSCPSLVIGGLQDTIVPPEALQLFTKSCLPKAQLHWFQSGHVDHLRQYPDAYKALIKNFLNSLPNPAIGQDSKSIPPLTKRSI